MLQKNSLIPITFLDLLFVFFFPFFFFSSPFLSKKIFLHCQTQKSLCKAIIRTLIYIIFPLCTMKYNRLREKIAKFYFESENVKKKFTLDSVFKSICFHKKFAPKQVNFCVLCVNIIHKKILSFHCRNGKISSGVT